MEYHDQRAAQLIFSSNDPAAVKGVAQAVTSGLKRAGEEVAPAYSGAKGSVEVFMWLVAATAAVVPVITLADLALKLAQLLNEIKKLRGGGQAPAPLVIIVRAEGAEVTLPSDTAPSETALLAQLLAQSLPAEIGSANLSVVVQVPHNKN